MNLEELTKKLSDDWTKYTDALNKQRNDYVNAASHLGGLGQRGFAPFQRAYEESELLTLYGSNKKFRDEIRGVVAKYDDGEASPTNSNGTSNAGGK